jgi:hypothetical protein
VAIWFETATPASYVSAFMSYDDSPRHMALRFFLTADAAVLLALGLALMFIPDTLALAFHFGNLPDAVNYIGGVLGCVFVSLGIGYVVATGDPVKHVMWVWIGIARAGFEVIFSVVCLIRGMVNWEQAAFTIVAAGLIAIGYTIFYPREAAHP